MIKIIFAICTSLSISAFAADRFAEVEIDSKHLAGSAYVLTGAGGNIGASAGSDGLLIIDDQFEPLAEKISAALADINTNPLRYVINTHYHGDHTGGNAWFHEIKQVTIFAQENVRKRLLAEQPDKPAALPVVTFEQGVKFHFNGDTIKVIHLPAGHTDGDSVVWFEKANVLHAGDLFFEGRFPYIDLDGGGSVSGYMQNVQSLIDMLAEDTQIIPGHGKLANKTDYQQFLDMIKQTAAYVKEGKDKGLSLESMLTAGLASQWKSWDWNFITEEKWITTLYKGQ